MLSPFSIGNTVAAMGTGAWNSESPASIGSFSVTSIDSSDDTILSSGLDPMSTVQDALDYFQREIDEFGK
jgi:hypothetical protein